ncbi:hypothetical protein [Methylocystis hirsuta]|uniref:hypothetical protein n=1 Tax=Methylocystis hirsuta TaxID=369798 RepID=UPI001FE0DBD7|nr:hypothetical protein [Methylocystis hirsuta]
MRRQTVVCRGATGCCSDADLSDLPQAMRWREWMGRVEAAIFAAPSPVTRDALTNWSGAIAI